MPKKPLKIIGINPGTRYLGIAVFQNSDLRDWRIKVFQEKWSKKKMERIKKVILNFIEQYEPNVLAIKKLRPSRSSQSLKQLVTRIKILARNRELQVYQYGIKDLENCFSDKENLKNKKRLAEVIASEYPVLFHELKRERSNRNPYFMRMFEAVALASVVFNRLDK